MSIKYLTAGECAITVQFGETICIETNRQVMMLHNELTNHPHPAIIETVPSYCALMVHYEPEIIGFQELKAELAERISRMSEAAQQKAVVTEIPVLYGGEHGIDLEECAKQEGITTDELIRIHSGHDYYVYMLGFAPGHPYTARFSQPFQCRRRATPRVKVSGGSVVIIENLSNILPFDQPCGWNLIGHTPIKLCDYEQEVPFLLKAGQWIRFKPVGEQEYREIARQAERKEFRVNTYERMVV